MTDKDEPLISGSRASTPSAGPRALLTKVEWLAKREARRERQREQNLIRSAKMHAARIAFDASNTPDLKRSLSEHYVGCSGWFYWHWRGRFYPEDAKTSEWFSPYTKQFSTVELNAPFYAWPTIGTVKTWRKQIGRRRFALVVGFGVGWACPPCGTGSGSSRARNVTRPEPRNGASPP